jgi:large subunit ribosomal protein L6
MSRIGKLPIQVPAGVTVTIGADNTVVVKGPKGSLSQKIHKDMKVTQEGGVLHVLRPSDDKMHKSLHGLYRTLISNMVVGVTKGFEKVLQLEGVGYRAQAEGGKKLTMSLGYSHPVAFDAPDTITFETPTANRILVKGIDKQQVGSVAADIRAARKVEPYHGKGVRYEGERVIHKEGKSGKTGKK